MKKLFSLGALLMLAMCAGFICSCNDDVEETPPTTVTPSGGNATENKDPHEYVDLGLPSGTLWATCNVGANSPEESGDYFAWGETTTKSTYEWGTYKYSSDDAATANWGSGWQMPSLEQFFELYNSSYTTTTWTTLNGVKGRKITSKSNRNSIFLPAAGYCNGTSLTNVGDGHYWSRSRDASNSYSAYYLYFYYSGIKTDYNYRCYGRSVRPVRVKK